MDPNHDPPRVLVHRAIPTDPLVRSSESLFLTETAGQAGTPSRTLLFAGPSPAPPAIAAIMNVQPGEDLVTRRRLMLVDGVPVRLAVSYFRADTPEADELSRTSFIEGGLQVIYDRYGRRFGRSRETLVARRPTPEEMNLLNLDPADPVVDIVRTSFDAENQPVHTLQTICAAGRHVFVIKQPPEDHAF